ncbi:pimeloyl-ACP methyl ester carboxylesterase [Williamsia limnetica]|uniref:Pimeloyl-ACP methyl ester carboxylesterase n=1 Tax=Williamsia limnetica TaxID=882452 RepID=A0A318RCK2_WILLI|nr:epoxide hydrolase family protein [Williamsia limnetica]PYE12426.1 pimeloyl-ACP methyl ester carboxylesterase [Williamsia limnetica]
MGGDKNVEMPAYSWERVSNNAIEDLHRRLRSFRPAATSPTTDWDRGIPAEYLDKVVKYWLELFDWRAQEDRIASYPWVRGTLEGTVATAIHQRSANHGAKALVLLHGWPDSMLRFERVLPLLSDVHVVVPCLPGYPGALHLPDRVATPTVMAGDIAAMMRALGYADYVVSGGDVGAIVAHIMASRYPDAVTALHLTDIPAIRLPADLRSQLSDVEQEYYRDARRWRSAEGAYRAEQATKPHTLAAGLSDSPAGVAAWIIEKLHGWSDCNGDVESVFPLDDMLTWVSLYWFTNCIGTSFDPYSAPALDFGPITAPAAISMFRHGLVPADRPLVERIYDVKAWATHDSGGHFAAWERPAEFVRGVREALELTI